jgi:hypothetical protein
MWLGPAQAVSTTSAQTFIALPSSMRIAPTPSLSAPAHFNYHVPGVVQQAATGFSVSFATPSSVTMVFSGFIGSFAFGQAARIESNNANGVFYLSAEL